MVFDPSKIMAAAQETFTIDTPIAAVARPQRTDKPDRVDQILETVPDIRTAIEFLIAQSNGQLAVSYELKQYRGEHVAVKIVPTDATKQREYLLDPIYLIVQPPQGLAETPVLEFGMPSKVERAYPYSEQVLSNISQSIYAWALAPEQGYVKRSGTGDLDSAVQAPKPQ